MLLFPLVDYTILGTVSLYDFLIFGMSMRVGVAAEMNAVFPALYAVASILREPNQASRSWQFVSAQKGCHS